MSFYNLRTTNLEECRVLSSAENSKSVRNLYSLSSHYRKMYFAGYLAGGNTT